jgi:hypothetical protein
MPNYRPVKTQTAAVARYFGRLNCWRKAGPRPLSGIQLAIDKRSTRYARGRMGILLALPARTNWRVMAITEAACCCGMRGGLSVELGLRVPVD